VVNLVKKVADAITIPFTVGGGISSLEDVKAILDAGADKISINTAAVKNPDLLEQISNEYDSKRLVCAIDANRVYVDSKDTIKDKNAFKIGDKFCWFEVLIYGGTKSTGMDAIQWSKKVKELGAGEILPTSKSFDGTKKGYDLEMTRGIAEATGLPVTASGGAGNTQHILEAFTLGKASAALAASIFHFREVIIKEVKEYCIRHGVKMKI
jgi:cyclase